MCQAEVLRGCLPQEGAFFQLARRRPVTQLWPCQRSRSESKQVAASFLWQQCPQTGPTMAPGLAQAWHLFVEAQLGCPKSSLRWAHFHFLLAPPSKPAQAEEGETRCSRQRGPLARTEGRPGARRLMAGATRWMDRVCVENALGFSFAEPAWCWAHSRVPKVLGE